MKNNLAALQQVKASLSAEQAKRDAIVEKGKAAFHLGIEERHCPEKDLSARKLWLVGWQKAKERFDVMFPPRARRDA